MRTGSTGTGVQTVTGYGVSRTTGYADVRTRDAPGPPGTPQNLAATATDGEVELTWDVARRRLHNRLPDPAPPARPRRGHELRMHNGNTGSQDDHPTLTPRSRRARSTSMRCRRPATWTRARRRTRRRQPPRRSSCGLAVSPGRGSGVPQAPQLRFQRADAGLAFVVGAGSLVVAGRTDCSAIPLRYRKPAAIEILDTPFQMQSLPVVMGAQFVAAGTA